MPIQSDTKYVVIKCKPIQGVPWNYGVSTFHSNGLNLHHKSSPHYHIIGSVNDGSQYTIVINIESRDNSTPMLLYYINPDFKHAITTELSNKFGNSYAIIQTESTPDSLALDYVRSGLFDHTKMVLENTTQDGQDSLNEIIDGYIKQAIREGTDIYAFGQEYFDGQQGNGVHDIHMNQGNESIYASEDGVYMDGGLLIYYPTTGKWLAMFFAFQSQSFNTDPKTGHRLD